MEGILKKVFGMLANDKHKYAKVIAQHLSKVLLYELTGSKMLYPDLREKYYQLYDIMQKHGMPIKLVETFRSVPRQNSLRKDVTNAKGLQSLHNYGLAFDVHFRDYKWRPPHPSWWTVLGEEGEKLGMTWGGRWTLRDYGHFQSKEADNLNLEDLGNYFKNEL